MTKVHQLSETFQLVINTPKLEVCKKPSLPYITRSWFLTSLEGFPPSRDVGMPREPLYHLESRCTTSRGVSQFWGKIRLSRAKIKQNQHLSRDPKPYHLLRLSRGYHQTIPTYLEELNHTILTSLEGQNHTNITSLEEQNHTISTSLEGKNQTNSAPLQGKAISSYLEGQIHTICTFP